MKIIVFGLDNENSLLSKLRKRFPSIGFQKYTPSVELEEEGPDLVVLDTIKGIDSVTLIDDLNDISPGRALSGSEMLLTLRIMVKIGSLKSVKILAVPIDYPEDDSFHELSQLIESLQHNISS